MNKHTPGPWWWEYEDDSMYQLLHKVGNMEGWVLSVGKCESCQGTEQLCMFPKTADAQLIAAAPELLKALQEALTGFPTDEEHSIWDGNARAAIKKATGEDS